MKFDRKWYHVLALAITFPSSILVTAYGFHLLIEAKVISPLLGWGIFIFLILGFIIILIKDAFNPEK